MSQQDDGLENLVAFGAHAEAFLKGPIGRYLLDRSREEIDAAMQELKAVDPEDAKRIRALQAIVARNEGVECWLGEIVQAGWDARNLLAGEEI